MEHPLENYRKIAQPEFITYMEQRFYIDHYNELVKDFHVEIEKDKGRMYINGVDLEGKNFDGYVLFTSYFYSEYEKLEKECRTKIDKVILANLEESKQNMFIIGIISELKLLGNKINKTIIESSNEIYKSILLDKLKLFSFTLSEIYLTKRSLAIPKIQWLGKTNLLGTLIFDLWQGQDKGKQPSTKPLIKAQKKDLEALLRYNFIDEKGEPLKENTISDYLNTSKGEKRAKFGVRIELT